MKPYHPFRPLLPFLAACMTGLGLLFAITKPVSINMLCPVTGKPSDESKIANYTKELKFCGEKCRRDFNMNPDGRVNEIAAYRTKSAKCLLCSNEADKEKKVTYLRVLSFSDESCLPTFAADPDKFIVFAVNHPRPANAICPVSGGEVDPRFIVAYHKDVWFCCPLCQETFNKDRDANVEKVAKFSKSKEWCLMCEKKFEPDYAESYRRTVGFSSGAAADTFRAEPDTHIAKSIRTEK